MAGGIALWTGVGYDAAVFLAASVAMAAVALGLALGLLSGGGSWLVGALRTFAFTAALTVALTHLLPEAFAELGAPALLLFVVASVGPAWREVGRTLAGRAAGGGHGASSVLGAGYVGLLVHHVGDGLGLGAYSELPGGAAAHADVLLALAVHTVPLVAVVTLAFKSQRGPQSAVTSAAGLAAASVGGVALSGVVPASLAESLTAWIAAAVAGLLLHVVTHDLGRDLPATALARVLDAIAAIAGIAVSMLGSEPALVELRRGLGARFVTGFAEAAPALFAGLLLAVLFVRTRPNDVTRWLDAVPGAAHGLDGALLGVLFGGVRFGCLFWVGTALAGRAASRAAGHRLEATPSSPLHGAHAHGSHAHAHAHGSHAHAHGSHAHGDPGHRSHQHASHAPPAPAAAAHAESAHSGGNAGEPHVSAGSLRAAAASVHSVMRERTAWDLVGLGLYALFSASLRPGALAVLPPPLALGVAMLAGVALELPATTAVLIACALWERGLRSEAALAFAVLAAARTRVRSAPFAVTLLVALVAAVANLATVFEPMALPRPLELLTMGLVAATFALASWRPGARGLFAGVFHSHDSA